MAIVLKNTYSNNILTETQNEPILYIASINTDGYALEMRNIIVRYIRETLNENTSEKYSCNKYMEIKYINHLAKDENDIYYNKEDGYWIIENEKEHNIILYQRKKIIGFVYNTIQINKLFSLTYKECPKIVPQVFKKTTEFDNFVNELTNRVATYNSTYKQKLNDAI